jgi:hypothetical protein
MSLDTIMNLSITVESRSPTQAGFGTPLLFGYHTHTLDLRVKEYSQADDMLDDGFTTNDALYKAAQIVKSQNPAPDTFKIGRRVTPLTQVIKLTVINVTEGFKYKGTVGGKALSYTVLNGATTTSVATALAAAINALAAGTTAVGVAAVITCTAGAAGAVIDFDFSGMPLAALTIEDATSDSTTDDELPAISAEDDDWYGLLVIDSSSKATGLHAAAWTEARRKLCVIQTADSAALSSIVTDDIMSSLKDSSYARTGCIYHRAIGGVEWLAAGWLAGALTTTPGAATMAFKAVPGVKVDKLLAGEESTILTKNGSHYTNTGGLAITFEGKSGAGEFMDTTHFSDWVYARMREAVLGALANNPKIPYTDAGVDIMRGLILSVIQAGITAGGFADTPAPTVTAPKVKDVAAANRISRILPDLNWTAQLAGAIHRLNPVQGRVSV